VSLVERAMGLTISVNLLFFLHMILHFHQLLGQSEVRCVSTSSKDVIISQIIIIITEFSYAFFVIIVHLIDNLIISRVSPITMLSILAHLSFKLFLLAWG